MNNSGKKHYYNLGLSLRSQGDLDEAILNFRKAIEIEPGYVEAYYHMANVFQTAGVKIVVA